MATLENGRTLVDHLYRDDSLIGGDFEIIEPNVPFSENEQVNEEGDQGVGQWSIQQSITLNGHMSINMATIEAPDEALDAEKTLPNKAVIQETPLLDGGSVLPSLHDVPQSENSMESWNSSDTLNSVLASQAETKELLVSSIQKIEKMTEELSQLDGLKKVVEELQKELTEKNRKIRSLEEFSLINTEKAKKEEEAYALLNKEKELDSKENSLNSLKFELDAARATIAEIQDSRKYLNDQLDEMAAKYVQEKELRNIVEEQFNSVQQGRTLRNGHHVLRRRRSGISSTVLYDERGVAEQLRMYNEQIKSLKSKVDLLEEEVKNRDEIINVLREDHLEGNRLIAEREQKIGHLEQIMESQLRRLQSDSS